MLSAAACRVERIKHEYVLPVITYDNGPTLRFSQAQAYYKRSDVSHMRFALCTCALLLITQHKRTPLAKALAPRLLA